MNPRLLSLYKARREALEAEASVLDCDDEAELTQMLRHGIEDARAGSDRTERSFRLQVLADLCPKVRDPGALALLLTILNDDDDSVRARAAMALSAACQSRYPEVVRVAQDALESGLDGPALLELPGLLIDSAGVEYPPPIDLLVMMIEHDNAEVVAEAACALAEIDLPGVRELLESLADDGRTVVDSQGETTLGELITDLLAAMELGDAVDAAPRGQA